MILDQASEAPASEVNDAQQNWRQIVRKYQTPSLGKSLWQVTNTGIPYLALWVIMYFTTSISWPLTLAFGVACGALFDSDFYYFS
jgi:omega-6 fatty acid desaturase (delta-12 desaturase)